MNADNPVPSRAVHVNSLGFLPDQPKVATVLTRGAAPSGFRVVDPRGRVAFEGPLKPLPKLDGVEADLYGGDFGDFCQSGTWRVLVDDQDGTLESAEFRVGAGVYNDSLRLCMIGFYGQRCGVPVEFEYRGIRYAKEACHTHDGYLDHYDPARAGEIRDATGGWHDAGDYGKYIVNAGFAMGLMMSAWEHYGDRIASLKLPIPESGGALPDYLAELKFNLDWMLKMQFGDGRVSHKLTRTNFEPMCMPHEDTEKRFFVPWGTDATACFAATCSQAARVFRPFDPAYADTCLEAARGAMDVLKTMPWQGVKPDMSAFRTGGYLRAQHSDLQWAWMEFAETTGDPDAMDMAEHFLDQDNHVVDTDWDWGQSRNMGLYTWLRSTRPRNPDVERRMRAELLGAADRLVENVRTHAFGRGLRRSYWGCNGSLVRTSLNLMMAFDMTGKAEYRNAALAQLSYIYGNNPYGRSFVTGEGHNPPRFPHHRPSVADGIDAPWPGHLIGGPHPTELDWHDVMEDARTNETAINWDGALVFALAAFYDPEVGG